MPSHTEAERRRRELHGLQPMRMGRQAAPTMALQTGVSPLLAAMQQIAPAAMAPPAVADPMDRFRKLYGEPMHPASGIRKSPRLDSPEAVYARTQGAYDAMRAVDPRVEQAYSEFERILGGVPEDRLNIPGIQRYSDYNKGLAARGVSPAILAANARRVATGVDPDILDYHTELLNQLGGRIHAYYGEGPPRVFESQLEHGRPSMVDITPPTLQAKDILGGQLAREQMRSAERIAGMKLPGDQSDLPAATRDFINRENAAKIYAGPGPSIDPTTGRKEGSLSYGQGIYASLLDAETDLRRTRELGGDIRKLTTPEDILRQELTHLKSDREEARRLLRLAKSNDAIANVIARMKKLKEGEFLKDLAPAESMWERLLTVPADGASPAKPMMQIPGTVY